MKTVKTKYDLMAVFAVVIFAALAVFAVITLLGSKYLAAAETSDVDVSGRVFYFDSNYAGYGSGSKEAPYNDLSVTSSMTFAPGDKVLLKYGSVFGGCLKIYNSRGTADERIYFGCYGDERDGKPKINGYRHDGDAVLYVYNCEYITLDGYELFDTDSVEKDKRGVLIEAENAGVMSGITVQNMYIHDIRGYTDSANNGMSTVSKSTGGIQVWVKDASLVPTRYHALTIKDNVIHNVDNGGIVTWYMRSTQVSIQPREEGWENISYTDLEISGNIISNVGKNAIVVRSADGGVVEYNTIYETALRCISGNQIFTRDSLGTVIQYNEGFLNRMLPDSLGVFRDGSMLDPDLRSPETVWQYNYSHDNAFGLLTNCTDANDENVIVRYNVSAGDKSWLLNLNYDVSSMYIYNNTFFIPQGFENVSVIRERDKELNSRSGGQYYYYFNNLVYDLGTGTQIVPCEEGETASSSVIKSEYRYFYNNLFYSVNGIKNSDYVTSTVHSSTVAADSDAFNRGNPEIYSLPLVQDSVTERVGRQYADRFLLLSGSPALDAGIGDADFVSIPAVSDFYGNAVRGTFNIGAYAGAGVEIGGVELKEPGILKFKPFSNRGPEQKAERYFSVQDTYTGESDTAFHDEETVLKIRGAGHEKGASSAYLKFLIKAGDLTQEIKLFLKVNALNVSRTTLTIYALNDNDWFANTLNSESLPLSSGAVKVAALRLTGDDVGKLVEANITSLKARLFDDPVVTLLIVDEGGKNSETILGSYEDVDPSDASVFGSPYADVINSVADGVFYTTKSTWVGTGSRSSACYVNDVTLDVKLGSEAYCRYTLLQFDLTSFAGDVETAFLKMYAVGGEGYNSGQPVKVGLFEAPDVWTRTGSPDISGLTFNTLEPSLKQNLSQVSTDVTKLPMLFREIASTEIYGVNDEEAYVWDITRYIANKLADGEKVVSILAASMYNENKNTVNVSFISRNNGAFPSGQPYIHLNDNSFIDEGYYNVRAKYDGSNFSAARGELTPQSQRIVRNEDAETITIKPYDGYKLSYVKVNGLSTPADLRTDGAGNTVYTLDITNVTREITVVVSFDVDAKGSVFQAWKDTYVIDGGNKDKNFGSEQTLEIKETSVVNGGSNKAAYLGFNVGSLTDRNPDRMYELSLYAYQRQGMNSGYRFPLEVYLFSDETDSWKEDELTWANKPFYADGNAFTVVEVTSTGWINIDITEFICNPVNAEMKHFTVVLKDKDAERGMPMLRMYSSESGAANGGESLKPRLTAYDETVYTVSADYDADKGSVVYNAGSGETNANGFFKSTRAVNGRGFEAYVLPAAGYMVGKVTVNGEETLLDGIYLRIERVTSDVDIKFSFVRYFSVNVVAGSGGKAILGNIVVGYGNEAEISVAPDETYVISKIYVNGLLYGGRETDFILENVTKRTDIFVEFEKGMKVTVNKTGEGTVSATQYVLKGTDAVVEIVPSSGMSVLSVKVNGNEVWLTTNKLTIKEINSDTVVDVVFGVPDSGINTWLIIGLSAGGAALLCAAIFVIAHFVKRGKRNMNK